MQKNDEKITRKISLEHLRPQMIKYLSYTPSI